MKYIAKVKLTTITYLEFNIDQATNKEEAWSIAKNRHSQRVDETEYFQEQEVIDIITIDDDGVVL